MGKNRPMDISARTDYAVRAMLTLAEAQHDGVGHVTAESVASSQGLPKKFLEAILSELRRAGLVASTRGAAGGYTLGRPADQISLGEIFRAVDGPLAEVRGLRPHDMIYQPPAQHLPTVWVAVRASLRRVLDETSLAAVAAGDLPEHVVTLSTDPDAWRNR
jgi:Rrf2 family protein